MTTRLLLVTRPATGGMAGHLQALCAGLPPERFHICLAGPDDLAIDAACARCELPIADRFAPRHDTLVIWRLRRLLASGRFDVAHVHGLKAVLLAAAATWPRSPIPVVYTLHNALPAATPGMRGYWREMALRQALRQAAALIVVSQAQAADLRQRRLLPAERVQVVPNGISLAALDDPALPAPAETRSALGIGPGEIMVLTVARAIAGKGLDDLIDAALMVDAPRFVVAGDGPEKNRLQARAAAAGLGERVQFLGHRTDIPALLHAADIFLLPSHMEGMPLAIMEAMAARLPVVATAVGGVPEVVVDGQTGLLVPHRQPAALAAAVARLAAEPELRHRLGEAGRALVEERFTVERMLAAVAAVYDAGRAGR